MSTTVSTGQDRLAQALVASSGGFPTGCVSGETARLTTYDVSDGALVDSGFNVVFFG
jgi:hypothetical protein